MGQRSKVLDTEGQTPKFLYAIIKQLDMKTVDWNRVASDLEISNGHAARMRYSRFKSQMEPSSAQKNARKKNSKKGEKGEPKGEIPGLIPVPMSMQMPFPLACAGPVPKMEPSDSQFTSNPFVKCEPGIQQIPGNPEINEIPDFQQHFPQIISPSGMPYPSHISQYLPHGLQFSMVSGASPSLSSLHPSHFENSYPSRAPPNDAGMQNFSLQQPAFHNAPVITWEPPAPSQQESTPMKIEDEPEIIERTVFDKIPIKVEEGCKG
ncbi:uncharacterized protein N7498_003152 [Penicillium cinerascens]|uniref:Myb-like DNA-binding domain-containing protein n=1 Tax=Penicillium cinerascens TaxID=70096 RepID=A0A9W9T6V7_9EURO|nr:uncharacterized protein N7498_003152 [Penicillium cinerascens]KAJ5211506.1 hypothetical protein N7498_003152 [Penicillium cinerascens]